MVSSLGVASRTGVDASSGFGVVWRIADSSGISSGDLMKSTSDASSSAVSWVQSSVSGPVFQLGAVLSLLALPMAIVLPVMLPFKIGPLQSLRVLSQLLRRSLRGRRARTLASTSSKVCVSSTSCETESLATKATESFSAACQGGTRPVCAYADDASVSMDALSGGGDDGRGLLRGWCDV